MNRPERILPPYQSSLAGTLLSAREAVMAPLRPVLRDANITEQQWRVLRVLAEQTDMDAAAIATTAMLLAPSVTRILRELNERGLISRQPDAHDGRRTIVSITPPGRALLASTAQLTLAVLDDYFAAFGQERLQALIGELASFRDSIAHLRPKE